MLLNPRLRKKPLPQPITHISQKGFTLIELLIVIVLIGVLAAVLVSIINPQRQQNTANDATVKSLIVKVSLSTEGFISSYNRLPTDEEFLGSLETNVVEYNNTCGSLGSPDNECLFGVSSINMPTTCNISNWTGTVSDSNQCYLRYYSGSDLPGNTGSGGTNFRIYAKSFGVADSVFVYDNDVGGSVRYCPYDIDDSDTIDANCE